MKRSEYQLENSTYFNDQSKRLTDDQFNELATYLTKKYGLRVPYEKKLMLESRLLKRLNQLNIGSFDQYLVRVLKSTKDDEYLNFVDVVTTHKTYFFREDYQFHCLREILPNYLERHPGRRQLNFWSAGCSTGEEVYSLGIILNEFKKTNYKFDYKITGTDISVPSLSKAARAVYSLDEIKHIPSDLKSRYLKSIHKNGTEYLKFDNAEVNFRIKFGVQNLNNPFHGMKMLFDFIFCRNVIIYFDAVTKKKVLEKLIEKIKPGGYLFLGHSETAVGANLPIISIQPTIYQKILK